MAGTMLRGHVSVDDRPIDVLDIAGDQGRPVIVLLHEGLGSVDLWRTVPGELQAATGCRTIAYSRFGHGRSAPPATPRTPSFFHEEALEVLPALLAALGVERPVLVGHSDGASIALVHAASHDVAALVLLAPHVVVEDITIDAIRETREQFLTGDLCKRMARHHDDVQAAFWGWCDVWLDPAFRAWSLEREAARLTVPTLLIQGRDDPYGTLDQLDRIELAAAGPIRRLVVPGGHSPHLEAVDETLPALAEFIAGLTG
jgi:pimeloyl-ACP methyl ester carboxylesterase